VAGASTNGRNLEKFSNNDGYFAELIDCDVVSQDVSNLVYDINEV
jgi:hypothetical protein